MSRDPSSNRPRLSFAVLGPLDVRAGDAPLRLSGPRQERVLALLLAHAGSTVGVSSIVDAVWPDDPPATARRQVQDLAAGLRRVFREAAGEDLIATSRAGYRLDPGRHGLDLARFEELLAGGRRREALGLWRGEPFAGLGPGFAHLAGALEERRLAAWEECLTREAGDRDADVVPELRAFALAHPLREPVTAALITALHHRGRRAEALDAFEELRARLAGEFGVDPGPLVREAHLAVLREEGEVPAQLPAAPRGFVGRAAELSALDGLLDAGEPRVAAISGTGGIGKSALALHWAHRAAHHFPDGVLHADLRGFGPDAPAEPADVLAGFLSALGVRSLPDGLDTRAALYRTRLAGRRVLVVLDNARDAAQVRPLLPGSPGALAVVTGREALRDLLVAGAHALPLEPLTPGESARLLTERLGERAAGAVDAVAARCGGLPLALALVAARAALRPRVALTDLLGEIGETLTEDLAAVFSWSLREVDDASARLFALLGRHPGAEFGTAQAASLAGLPDVRPLLRRLAGAGLLTERGQGRYAMHDLLRDYALTLPGEPEAEERLADHYLRSACAANVALSPVWLAPEAPALPGVTAESFTGPAGRAWHLRERAVLVALARRDGPRRAALAIAATFTVQWQGAWAEQLEILRAARTGGGGDGRLLVEIARREAFLGRFEDAHATLDTVAGEAPDVRAERARLHVWLNERGGAITESLRTAHEELRLHRESGHAAAVVRSLSSIAWLNARLGGYAMGMAFATAARRESARLGLSSALAVAEATIGYLHLRLRQPREAVRYLGRALPRFRELRQDVVLAESLGHLADAHELSGDHAAAGAARREASAIRARLAA
ncbi:XRE family transcriptional regulator [Actinorhabdospora filicis]|uniref:XRE family transcriptional regulator n=1 Tax=Actinorhabdospora filicis TaxID=1785913 RepID=A0A9W6SQ71_9ACTN|nr:BTAD domain-containing putative transcriptional regulator [Actinorhabdospora filicis]GLZ80127.1 XRE family transcriptional regulator [Actinorhabdospora filicis]